MARDVLAIPISSVASESAFSTGGRVLSNIRSSLTPAIVEALICAEDWLRSTSPDIFDPEEEENENELLEFEKGKLCCNTRPESTRVNSWLNRFQVLPSKNKGKTVNWR
ncbi:Putative AC9 transposase [Linum perenne]